MIHIGNPEHQNIEEVVLLGLKLGGNPLAVFTHGLKDLAEAIQAFKARGELSPELLDRLSVLERNIEGLLRRDLLISSKPGP